jgi:HEAT repeat protein
LTGNKAADAIQLYDAVRNAEVPRQRMLDATRGAILARGHDGIPLLIEQLRSSDKGLFQIALFTAREFPGDAVDKALSEELERAFPERAALIIAAMADRPKTVDLAGLLKASTSGGKPVRLAAIGALGRLGNATHVSSLLEAAVDPDAEIAAAAKDALAALPDKNADREIVTRLQQAQGKSYPVLIELVGKRRIEATEPLLKGLESSDPSVRHAALTALGETISDKHLAVLINQVVSPKDSQSAEVAHSALKTAAVRMPDREACAAQIAAAMDRQPVPVKTALLDILAAVGGSKALATVAAAAKAPEPALQDAATQVLGEWMTIDAAPVLLDLARSNSQYAVRALRGYIRIARQFTMDDAQRAQMCRSALEAARRPDERKLVLEVVQRYPSVEMLKIAVRGTQFSDVKEDAKTAAKAISQKVRRTDEVRDLLSKAGVAN